MVRNDGEMEVGWKREGRTEGRDKVCLAASLVIRHFWTMGLS